jgi:plastocyanin
MVYPRIWMRRIAPIVGLVLVVAVAVAGIAQAAPKTTITVGNNFLAPSSKTVGAGTKLRFKWVGGERHKIVKTKGPGGEIKSPATSAKGVNLAKTVSKTGTYRFICVFHPKEMRLKLTVVR